MYKQAVKKFASQNKGVFWGGVVVFPVLFDLYMMVALYFYTFMAKSLENRNVSHGIVWSILFVSFGALLLYFKTLAEGKAYMCMEIFLRSNS